MANTSSSNTKLCTKCKKEKPLEQFPKRKDTKRGVNSYCKECSVKITQDYKKRFPWKQRANQIKNDFGLEWEEFLALYNSQNGCCAICQKPLKLYSEAKDKQDTGCVDHCHTTLKIRGILCFDCNTGLGKFLDSPSVLRHAANYLERNL